MKVPAAPRIATRKPAVTMGAGDPAESARRPKSAAMESAQSPPVCRIAKTRSVGRTAVGEYAESARKAQSATEVCARCRVHPIVTEPRVGMMVAEGLAEIV